MKKLETLMLDTLLSISLNVGLEEIIGSLVGFDRIFKVFLGDIFGVFQECSNGLNARSA